MPVSTESSISGPYTPNGATTDFAFDFKATNASEVVAVDPDGAIISTALYSVTLDDDEGGTLSFSVAPALADYSQIYIVGNPALTQPSDFDNAGPSFNPSALTRALDRAAARDLKQQREIDRAFKVPFGETGPVIGASATDALGVFADLASEDGTSRVFHKPALASSAAIIKSMSTLLNDEPSLGHFFTYVDSADPSDATDLIGQANADNWAEVTHALQSLEFTEKSLLLPAGFLPMASMDFTTLGTDDLDAPAERILLRAQGTVQIVGTDGDQGFIFGSSYYRDNAPWVGDPPFIRGIEIAGPRPLIFARTGEVYDHAMQLEAFVSCHISGQVSGDFGSAAADRKAVAVDVSFRNVFDLSVGSPGSPGGGFKSYMIYCGPNNVNVNRFKGEIAGPGHTTADVVGLYLTGVANRVELDISAVETAIVEDAGRGNNFEVYAEAVKDGYTAGSGISRGTVLNGGYYDIQAGGTARNLHNTYGLTSIGGHRKFTGAGTTDIDFGTECSMPSIIGGTYDQTALPATAVTGDPDIDNDGFAESEALRTAAQTGTFTLDYTDVGLGGPGGTGDPIAKYIKRGREVKVFFHFSIPSNGIGGVRDINGITIAPDSDALADFAFSYQVNPNGYTFDFTVDGSGNVYIYPIAPTDGSQRTGNQMSNTEFKGVLTYLAAE